MDTKTPELTPEEATNRLTEVIGELSVDQLNFVVERQAHSKDCVAAEAVGISPETVKGWKKRGAPIDEAVRLMGIHSAFAAIEWRRRNLVKAMAIKVRGLDSNDESLRQKVATEIIEWELGRATQRQEVTGAEGGPVKTYVSISPDDWDDDE